MRVGSTFKIAVGLAAKLADVMAVDARVRRQAAGCRIIVRPRSGRPGRTRRPLRMELQRPFHGVTVVLCRDHPRTRTWQSARK